MRRPGIPKQLVSNRQELERGPPRAAGGTAPAAKATTRAGAPKIAAVDQIARLEPVGRGASMGALGTIRPGGDFDLALTIRTFALAEGRVHLWVGGGIVWDSDPQAEIEVSIVKARPLLELVGAPLPDRVRA